MIKESFFKNLWIIKHGIVQTCWNAAYVKESGTAGVNLLYAVYIQHSSNHSYY